MGITRLFDREPFRLKDRKAQEIALARPEQETHLTQRRDRVKKYLMRYMRQYLFNELTAERRAELGLPEIFSGVSIPFRHEDLEQVKNGLGVRTNVLAENMARVLGIDPHFKYREPYVEFITVVFGAKATDNLTRKAKDLADAERYEEACICFRAALVLDWKDIAGMYGYAKVLRKLYEKGNTEEAVGNMKAESFDYFEMLTELYPRFESGWYYLGYMYLNMGLYAKARLAWQRFLETSRIEKDKKEIRQRIRQIEEPVRIESGYNAALAGRWDEAIETLEPYRDSVYRDWWPLWYYLGVAYAHVGRPEDAISAFKDALKGNPRHIESMEELALLYKAKGDRANAKKYADKAKLIRGKA
ncbi:MAG: tetratricopeptide repeat protein [Clostridiales Family XIII bacterium]|jgi:tetratricopeptide (TPR) repeat protein|nr:tetratricopeptide repeat protein [Clostridiales Family XIII bacterium]